MSTQTFTVTGMTCGHCVKSVTEELSEIPGVTDVQVTLDSGLVSVTSEQELSRDAATAAVSEAGYDISAWN
ncbi:copper chaperone CopZ [Saccharopolyspora erythraea NRRL 2338]|uniref:Heavy metal transport/detoxification protein n=2 Tax=Saccharopolyspora erythraea TaxID=1836 RepID=A4FQ71_SACEN|nr:cation transporter [Saccharopolyspora erythraea]EQD86311.1 copper chaperone [Saccharopolyspora erythraea D]PFG92796.1 copper chaperone CopZ [Saccharopolyspora erythraea NRRL 2338]QRK89712.1 heavy-metal-associated domain-containing protein [Saccharopolyspora erythraea]CAM06196.1 heavy metal transport/detoxification protein [Saccharopolyspora erythraea NRRL 2338]